MFKDPLDNLVLAAICVLLTLCALAFWFDAPEPYRPGVVVPIIAPVLPIAGLPAFAVPTANASGKSTAAASPKHQSHRRARSECNAECHAYATAYANAKRANALLGRHQFKEHA